MSDANNESSGERAAGPFETLGRKIDERPEVRAAEDVLRQAQLQLEQARKKYHEVRAEAAESIEGIRARSVGDVLEAVLEQVKKHPGPGVVVALACGWIAGRIFRR